MSNATIETPVSQEKPEWMAKLERAMEPRKPTSYDYIADMHRNCLRRGEPSDTIIWPGESGSSFVEGEPLPSIEPGAAIVTYHECDYRAVNFGDCTHYVLLGDSLDDLDHESRAPSPAPMPMDMVGSPGAPPFVRREVPAIPYLDAVTV